VRSVRTTLSLHARLAVLADEFVRDAACTSQLSPAARAALEQSPLGRALLASSVVGSVIRAGDVQNVLRRTGGHRLHPRSIDRFVELVAMSVWAIEQVVERPLCYVVRMHKAVATA
jgi:hypothetical protein